MVFESDLNVGTEYVIYCGDSNVTINPDIDNLNYNTLCNLTARDAVKSRMDSHGLVDVWRKNNPLTKGNTWYQVGSERRARLDYFLTSTNLWELIIEVGMELADNLSDHGSTWLELGKTSKKRGKWFWRFNKSFLSNPEFLETTNSLIRDTIKEYSVDDFNNVDVDDSILKSDLSYPST